MKKRTTTKRGIRWLRWRKNDHAHNVHVAVQRFVHAHGGSILVSSGPEIQDWHDGAFKFRVAIGCVGRPPQKPADSV